MDGQAAPCAVAIAVLHALEREGLIERAAALGRALLPRLAELPGPIGPPRGRGLMLGLPTVGIEKARLDRWLHATFAEGLLLHRGGTTLTLFPPLVISDGEVELLLSRLARALVRLSKA
jgi:4-aminobutyrate aminotransferase-like enzyme